MAAALRSVYGRRVRGGEGGGGAGNRRGLVDAHRCHASSVGRDWVGGRKGGRAEASIQFVPSPSFAGDELAVEESFSSSAAPSTTRGFPVARVGVEDILSPVSADFELMRQNLRDVVGSRHPMLVAAAEDIFGAGGKRIRPMLALLVARATIPMTTDMADICDRQRRLAEIVEMIHTASLVHDDVLDECELRRGKPTTVSAYGTRFAVLAGDFLFAQSSWYLANLDNLEVIKLISQVIADFADGEIAQAQKLYDINLTFDDYNEKSFRKTASLIAAACRSASVFSEVNDSVKNAMYEYGRHLGLAFQIVDDILDFTTSEELLGKPQGQDLASGNLTAPTLFALQKTQSTSEGARLTELIEGRFGGSGDLEEALMLIERSGAIESSRLLAKQEGEMARSYLDCLPSSPSKDSLSLMVDYVLNRLY